MATFSIYDRLPVDEEVGQCRIVVRRYLKRNPKTNNGKVEQQ